MAPLSTSSVSANKTAHEGAETALWQGVLPDAAATTVLGQTLAPALAPGDVVLLRGDLGAGKTALARAMIQARATLPGEVGAVPDVPSPSFTLVQTYEIGGLEIWHADLYRIADAGELAELGLAPPPPDAALLVEWPERAPEFWPDDAVTLALEYDAEGEGRSLTLLGQARAPLAVRLLQCLTR